MAATGTAKAPHSARSGSGKLLDRIEKVHREGIAIDSLSSASKEILSKANKNGRFCISYNIPNRT